MGCRGYGCKERSEAIVKAAKSRTAEDAKRAASVIYKTGTADLKRLLNLKRNRVIK